MITDKVKTLIWGLGILVVIILLAVIFRSPFWLLLIPLELATILLIQAQDTKFR
jgi:hypothetical protein